MNHWSEARDDSDFGGGAPCAARGREKRPQNDTVLKRAWRGFFGASLWPVNTAMVVAMVGIGLYGLVASSQLTWPQTELWPRTVKATAALGFTIKQVTITGRDKADASDITAALDARRGMAILDFDTKAARERLEKLGWVDKARVSRFLPDRIHVAIDERAPYALWQTKGKVVIVDKEGVVLAGLRLRDHLHLPLVVGRGAGAAAKALMDQLKAHEEIAQRVRASVRIADRRWTLKLDGGLDVLLPEKKVAEALSRLDAMDRQMQLLSRALVAVDLRLHDRVTLRQGDDAAGVSRAPLASNRGGGNRSGG